MRAFFQYRCVTIAQHNVVCGKCDAVLKNRTKDVNKGIFFEFGAWDGRHSSNTFVLVERCDFNAIYIEADKNKFKQLLKTAKQFPKIVPINLAVGRNESSANSLD